MMRALRRELRWRPVRFPALRVCAAGVVGWILVGALCWALLTAEPRASLVLAACLFLLSFLVREPRA